MHIVEIRRDSDGLTEAMSRMRDWLDTHGIEPKIFGFDAGVFRLGFATARDAVSFARAFDGSCGSDSDRLAA